MRITLVDLGIQNLASVENAFRTIGAQVAVAADAASIDEARFLVLPGVGAFGAAAARLEITGMAAALRRHALERRRPLVGLCLGMQLLADGGEEDGDHHGLGLVPGRVVRLQDAPPSWRVPNIGWREVTLRETAFPLLPRELDGCSYYHLHSFHLQCAQVEDIAGTSRFAAGEIAAIVHRGNVFGTQFHPEKSQDAGLDLLHAVMHGLAAAAE